MKKNIKQLQMSEKTFYNILEKMLELHTIHLEILRDKRQKTHTTNAINLYGNVNKWTLAYFDDFYEFLQHWKDYKKKKWSN